MQQTPRKDNSAADEAANAALDGGNFVDNHLDESVALIRYLNNHGCSEEVGILISFDGASRGNPGSASLGVCGWWGTWSIEGFRE